MARIAPLSQFIQGALAPSMWDAASVQRVLGIPMEGYPAALAPQDRPPVPPQPDPGLTTEEFYDPMSTWNSPYGPSPTSARMAWEAGSAYPVRQPDGSTLTSAMPNEQYRPQWSVGPQIPTPPMPQLGEMEGPVMSPRNVAGQAMQLASLLPQQTTPQPFMRQDEIPIQENQELMRQPTIQAQKKGLSDAAMWGLLSAGLGILQNNYGKYGQAGPAIGAGGMQGVNTYLGLRQQDVENQRRDMLAQQQGEYQRAQIEAQRANTDLQGRRVDLEEQRERQKSLQDLQSRNLALMLAGNDLEQQRIAVANPDKYLDFKVAQLKPEYKERSIKEGTQARDEYSIDGGKSWNPVPGGGKYDLRAAKGGSETNLTMQGAAEDFNKQSLKEQATALIKQYETLQNVPDQLAVMDEAEKALAAAGNFVGSGAEVKLGVAKFFNNNFGTNIGAEEVANAELLRSTLFRQIMENLKKLDAQPSQQQQKVMQESLGNLTTDPKAIPNIIRITREVLTSRAKAHNKRVRQAKENGAQFLYDITIPGFDEDKAPWE